MYPTLICRRTPILILLRKAKTIKQNKLQQLVRDIQISNITSNYISESNHIKSIPRWNHNNRVGYIDGVPMERGFLLSS
jgi:hypothetical protein